jgi:outer membrane protein OmpA-like peptidoglycan-associated protein
MNRSFGPRRFGKTAVHIAGGPEKATSEGRKSMSNDFRRLGLNVAYAAIAACLCLVLSSGFSIAEEQPSAKTIVNSLTPRPLTRSLSETAKNAEDNNFVGTLKNRPSNTLSTVERDKIATIAKDKPNIDLEIRFEYNSDRIGPAAMATVTELGKALSDPTMKGYTFILSGYADASGRAAYNQSLSERRAESVKRFLIEKYSLPATSLVTVGFGSTRFKNTSDPYAAENRRVGVTNMADKKIADK